MDDEVYEAKDRHYHNEPVLNIEFRAPFQNDSCAKS